MLATHMRLPILAFDDELVEKLQENFDGQVICQLDLHADWNAIEEALGLYRELSGDVGGYLCERLSEDDAFELAVEELRNHLGDSLKATAAPARKVGEAKPNPGMLNFKYLTWDLASVVCEYAKQHVLQPGVVREVCERALLLVASPG